MTRLMLGLTALAVLAVSGCGAAAAEPSRGTGPDTAAGSDAGLDAAAGSDAGPDAAAGSGAGSDAVAGRPADRAGLIRRWVPDTPANSRHTRPPFVELKADGTWTGSDGCNGLQGTWSAGGNGAWRASHGMSTKIFCENVDLGTWLSTATRATREGELLVLRDGSGKPTGRLRPAR